MPDPIPFCDHDKKFAEAQEGANNGMANVKTMHKLIIKSLAKKKKMRAHYAGLVQQIDYEVGRIVGTLKENDLFDNTIIIFASDHGDYLGDHGLFGKGTFIESSSHVPLIFRLRNYGCQRIMTLFIFLYYIYNVAIHWLKGS